MIETVNRIEDDAAELYDVTSLGSGIKLVKEDRAELTHGMAREVLEKAEMSGERGLRQQHVNNLIDTMSRKTFRWEWVTLITAKCREPHNGKPIGTDFRINGQHTCWARLEMPDDYRAPIRIARYVCQTENDLRQLYASCDRGAPRTRGNVIHAYLAGHEKFERFKAHALKVAPPGLTMWVWETKHQRQSHDGDDVAFLMHTEHYDVSCKVLDFLSKYRVTDSRHVLRSSVVGAMYATFNKVPTKAAEFWDGVTTGVGFSDRSDSRLRLRNYLNEHALNHGGGPSTGKITVDAERVYRICLVAWNAWRRGKSLTLLKCPDSRPAIA